eukprot:TRINITY_DN34313_c0_g1_i1.p1 TRINITY_DN34313_c0_g1~~TRINITY_DN34313_c0_g1_i1.p1  ORF type:complete len:161 (+),score=12.64 TRINITY_DN34313_c0_g1_i1:154-636(+)
MIRVLCSIDGGEGSLRAFEHGIAGIQKGLIDHMYCVAVVGLDFDASSHSKVQLGHCDMSVQAHQIVEKVKLISAESNGKSFGDTIIAKADELKVDYILTGVVNRKNDESAFHEAWKPAASMFSKAVDSFKKTPTAPSPPQIGPLTSYLLRHSHVPVMTVP